MNLTTLSAKHPPWVEEIAQCKCQYPKVVLYHSCDKEHRIITIKCKGCKASQSGSTREEVKSKWNTLQLIS